LSYFDKSKFSTFFKGLNKEEGIECEFEVQVFRRKTWTSKARANTIGLPLHPLNMLCFVGAYLRVCPARNGIKVRRSNSLCEINLGKLGHISTRFIYKQFIINPSHYW